VPVVSDHARAEAFAEQMALAPPAEVEALRVTATQVLDAGRELRLRRVDDDVVVVRHQAEHVDSPLVAVDRLREEREERAAVMVVADDVGAVHAAGRHVVDGGRRELGAEDSRHLAATLARENVGKPAVEEESRFRDARPCPAEPSPWV
jgi:hypothetical protein